MGLDSENVSDSAYWTNHILYFCAGLVFLFVIGIFLLLRVSERRGSSTRSTSAPSSNSVATKNKQPKQTREQVNTDNRDKQHEPVFTVRREKSNGYTFHLSRRLKHVQPGANVDVTLFWQDRELERYRKTLTIQKNRKVDLTFQVGGSRANVPPGLYRVRLSGRQLIERPTLVERMSEYLSDPEQGKLSVLFQNHPHAVEFAVTVGSRAEVEQFHDRMLNELRRRGQSLIDAWMSWRELAQSAYEEDQEQIEMKLFNRFMEVRNAVKELKGWIQERQKSYVILPFPSLRGELLKLSYILSKKVNALSMTVLKQVGASPFAWPDAYVQRGFGSNINVLYHMEQYDRETIQEIQKKLDQAHTSYSFSDLETYVFHQLKDLHCVVDQLKRLRTPPYFQFMRFVLSGDRKTIRTQRFRSLYKYIHDVLSLRRVGLEDVVNQFSDDELRRTTRAVLDLLRMKIDRLISPLADKLNSENINYRDAIPELSREPDDVSSRINQKLDRLNELVNHGEHKEVNCQ